MTDSTLPAPLVPSEVDLRDFPYMPVDVHRVLSSETWVLGSGDERAAAMTLWLASWHELPAGSLPENDRMLAHLSQSQRWAKAKAHALRGWVLCSDGRRYHPVVCEKVLEAWIEKLMNSLSGAAGNAKRWGVPVDLTVMQQQFVRAVDMLRVIAPQSKTLKKKAVLKIAAGSPPDAPDRDDPESGGESGGDPNPESGGDSRGDRKRERREREEKGKGIPTAPSEPGARARAAPKPATTVDRPNDVDAGVWRDWCALRKAKKAPVTETVITSAQEEASEAGMSFEAFLRIWCARGSQGLQADWLKPSERGSTPRQGTISGKDYRQGVNEDGSFE